MILQQRRETLTKLSQKIGVENIVGCKKAELIVNNNIHEELRRLSIVANDEESHEIADEKMRYETFLYLAWAVLPLGIISSWKCCIKKVVLL